MSHQVLLSSVDGGCLEMNLHLVQEERVLGSISDVYHRRGCRQLDRSQPSLEWPLSELSSNSSVHPMSPVQKQGIQSRR